MIGYHIAWSVKVCTVVYQQVWSFGYPVSGVSRAVVFACQDDEGNAVSLIAFSCLKDIHLTRQTGRGHVIMLLGFEMAIITTRQLVWFQPAATDKRFGSKVPSLTTVTASLFRITVCIGRYVKNSQKLH